MCWPDGCHVPHRSILRASHRRSDRLKLSSLDFKRKLIQITSALDYATRKEGSPKSGKSAAPVHMSELFTKHLHDWMSKHYKPNLHVVTRLMRHADSKVTLDHYAHIVGDAER